MTDKLVVLRSDGPAHKTYKLGQDGQIQKKDFRLSFTFRVDELAVANIREVGQTIAELEGNPCAFIVRGAPNANLVKSAQYNVPKGRILRRSYRKPLYDKDKDPNNVNRNDPDAPNYNPEMPAYLLDQNRRWMMVDVDSLSMCEGFGVEDVLENLPEELRGVTTFYQWSNSAFVGEENQTTAKIHFWFWLSDAVPNSVLRWWCHSHRQDDGSRLIDHAVMNPVQPHYIAPPTFEGMNGPSIERSGFIEGESEEVDVTSILAAWEKNEEEKKKSIHTGKVFTPLARIDEWNKLQDALSHLDPNMSHDEWIEVGQGIHNEFPGDGLIAWDAWSAGGGSYKSGECAKRWRSFGGGRGRTIATVYHMAQSAGWEHPADRMRREREEAIAETKRERQRRRQERKQQRAARSPGGSGDPAPPSGGALVQTKEEYDGSGMIQINHNTVAFIGEDVYLVETKTIKKKDGSTFQITVQTDIASNVIPIGHGVDVETGEPGVIFKFKPRLLDRWKEVFIRQECWFSGGDARYKAAQMFAREGVDAAPGKGPKLVEILGYWSRHDLKAPIRRTISHHGWHKDKGRVVYVNGAEGIYGAKDWHWRSHPQADKWRCPKEGSIEGLEEIVTTWGMRLALGVSLAGALLEPMGMMSFGVLFHGNSSDGKSFANLVSAVVWGNADEGKRRWKDKPNAMEFAFVHANGACLWIDDLKGSSREMRDNVSTIIHALSEGRTKFRAQVKNSDVVAAKVRKFHCTVSASAEMSLRKFMQGDYHGGHAVRMIEVAVKRGDTTQSAHHADDVIKPWIEANPGVIGSAWVEYLVGLNKMDWKRWRLLLQERIVAVSRMWAGDNEGGRIAKSVVLCGVALEMAKDAGIIEDAPGLDSMSVTQKTLANVLSQRGQHGKSPEERFLHSLRSMVISQRNRFPEDYRVRTGAVQTNDIVGIWETKNSSALLDPNDPEGEDGARYLSVLASTLDAAKINDSCSGEKFLEWAKKEGIAHQPSKNARRVAGLPRRRWWFLDLRTDEERADAPEDGLDFMDDV